MRCRQDFCMKKNAQTSWCIMTLHVFLKMHVFLSKKLQVFPHLQITAPNLLSLIDLLIHPLINLFIFLWLNLGRPRLRFFKFCTMAWPHSPDSTTARTEFLWWSHRGDVLSGAMVDAYHGLGWQLGSALFERVEFSNHINSYVAFSFNKKRDTCSKLAPSLPRDPRNNVTKMVYWSRKRGRSETCVETKKITVRDRCFQIKKLQIRRWK